MTRSSWSACLLLAAATAPALAQPRPLNAAPRTLKRTVDTVVISGADGGAVKGKKISQLRVYSCRGGYMTPITFQIDERDPTGKYCWTAGDKERRIVDNDKRGFDANDELVVLSRDAGDRALPRQLNMVPNAIGHQEIELLDPVSKTKAWIYVYVFPKKATPGRLTVDLTSLTYRQHADEERTYSWKGESFLFNNDRSRKNAVRATYAGFAAPGTKDWSKVPNLIDSTQVKAVVSFMWVTLKRRSNEFRVQLGGWIDGPLRVIAENRLKVYLAAGYWVSAPDSYLILWRNKMSMPTNASCPVNLDTSDESNYTLCIDMNKEVKGLQFYNSHNKTPVLIDGKMSPAERKLDMTYPDYNVIFGKQGAMITKFVVPAFLRRKEGSRLEYRDDASYSRVDEGEGVEFQAGAYGYSGFIMDMRGLKKGVYPGDYVVWYAPPGFKQGDEQEYLAEFDDPIESNATSVKR